MEPKLPRTFNRERLDQKVYDGVKVLGRGELEKKLTVKAHAFSGSATSKIEAAVVKLR